MAEDKTICPYCGQKMKKWMPPDESTWGGELQYVCFNDECPYYQKGWQWMLEQFQQKASYRYRYNADTGASGPLAVWSPNAMKNFIVDDE